MENQGPVVPIFGAYVKERDRRRGGLGWSRPPGLLRDGLAMDGINHPRLGLGGLNYSE